MELWILISQDLLVIIAIPFCVLLPWRGFFAVAAVREERTIALTARRGSVQHSMYGSRGGDDADGCCLTVCGCCMLTCCATVCDSCFPSRKHLPPGARERFGGVAGAHGGASGATTEARAASKPVEDWTLDDGCVCFDVSCC
jgi:hypothetical protein